MAIGDITLTASARSNLLSLQSTAKLLGQTQDRLSTGNKVNSALDNATSYFASQGFLNTANDLSSLKDSMSTALQTIQAATDAIDSLTQVVKQLQSIVTSALQTTDTTVREGYAAQYDALRSQLDALADDATFNGTNLVNSISTTLKVNFNTTNTTSVSIASTDLSTAGMGVGAAQGDFAVGSLAKEVTSVVTVQDTNTTATAAYSGTVALEVATATATGVGAVIGSTSGDFSDGALVTINSSDLLASADTTARLGTQVAGLTLTAGTAIDTGTDITTASIRGTFTATGGASSTYATATDTLTVGATTGSTISIAAGESIKVTYNQGGAKTATYTNQGTTAVTITLSVTGAADTVDAGNSNSTAAYTLSGGTIDYTGVTLAEGQTFGGGQIVDTSSAAVGTTVTRTTTTDGVGLTKGTTTSTGVTAYDMTNATVSAIAIGDVRASVTGTGSATYSATNKSMTVTGATRLSGTSTTVVDDALITAQNQLTDALSALRSAASSLGNNNSLVQARSDFTLKLINTLQTASDNLVLADTNEEGANLQALQARNQLGVVSLGISGELAQSVLRLF